MTNTEQKELHRSCSSVLTQLNNKFYDKGEDISVDGLILFHNLIQEAVNFFNSPELDTSQPTGDTHYE